MAQRIIEVTQHDLKATHLTFEKQLAAAETRTKREGGGNAGTSTDRVKPFNRIDSRPGQCFIAISRPRQITATGHPARSRTCSCTAGTSF
jgi:hypothetical protein